jgi:hypothetical protein
MGAALWPLPASIRMSCSPTSPESLEGLRDLLRSAAQRGDECFALLLAGVDLCVRAGREMEMLEAMRQHAHDMREAVEGTPTADELRRLYESD